MLICKGLYLQSYYCENISPLLGYSALNAFVECSLYYACWIQLFTLIRNTNY